MIFSPSPSSRPTQHASPKRRLLPTNPHGDLTQKNVIRIVTAVKVLKEHYIFTKL
jgi:hypothetical protein